MTRTPRASYHGFPSPWLPAPGSKASGSAKGLFLERTRKTCPCNWPPKVLAF